MTSMVGTSLLALPRVALAAAGTFRPYVLQLARAGHLTPTQVKIPRVVLELNSALLRAVLVRSDGGGS
jgi:hypothetical protein